MSNEDEAQKFIDYIANPELYCGGQVSELSLRPPDEAVMREDQSGKPNCGAHEDCQLFRPRPARSRYMPLRPSGKRGEGCDMKRSFEIWRHRQQWWIVEFEGFERVEVQSPIHSP